MQSGSKNKVLVMLVVALLVTNLGILWYFNRETKEATQTLTRSERMAEMMKKELGFSDAQAQEYLRLRQMRDSIMQPLNQDLRAAKMELIQLLRQPNVPDSVAMAAAAMVAERQAPLEMEYYRHFRRIQALCEPGQMGAFDSMLVRMVKRNTGDTTSTLSTRPN
jgi:hypothetical protein